MNVSLPSESQPAADRVFSRRPLGTSGIEVGPLCLAGTQFGSRTPKEVSCAIIDRALDAGINYLDASSVANAGPSEETARRDEHGH